MNDRTHERCFEEFAVGQTFSSGRALVNIDQLLHFAGTFDPQPFHLDPDAARNTLFGGLAASGWHTAALTMRLLIESDIRPAGGLIGGGCDELRWPLPVRPGDELHILTEILETRPLKTKRHHGLVKIRTVTTNQMGDAVQIMVCNIFVLRRQVQNA